MTRYERARILGTRSLQLAMGAMPTVEMGDLTDMLEVARKELREKKIPMVIRRYMPDGSFEEWDANDQRAELVSLK